MNPCRSVRWLAPLAACVLAPALLGCTTQAPPPVPLATGPPGPATTPSPQSTIRSVAEQAAIAEAMAVYTQFREIEDRLSLAPRPSEEVEDALAEVLASPLHTQVWAALAALHDDGLVRRAAPASDVEVVDVALSEPATVTLRECLDVASAPLVHAGSGEPAGDELRAELWMAASTPGRYVRTLQATAFGDRWLLEHGRWEEGQTC